MESKQKLVFQIVARPLGRLDARAPLPLLGLVAGALAGAGYTLESASHMVLPSPSDLYLVGLMLAALGAAAGWLVGAMLRTPLVRRKSGPDGEGAPTDSPAVRDRE